MIRCAAHKCCGAPGRFASGIHSQHLAVQARSRPLHSFHSTRRGLRLFPASRAVLVTLHHTSTLDAISCAKFDRLRANSAVTENTRASYPIDFIANARIPCVGPHPQNIILLCCDAFGVLPPVSKLTTEQAMYHFMSGYTAKVRMRSHPITSLNPNATCDRTCASSHNLIRR